MDHYSHPVGFWFYVTGCLVVIAAGFYGITLVTTYGLFRFMLVGVLLIVASIMLGPSTLDLTGWSIFVVTLMPIGIILLIGSPIAYALWVAFVSPHVTIGIR